jgi:hypothetical protein
MSAQAQLRDEDSDEGWSGGWDGGFQEDAHAQQAIRPCRQHSISAPFATLSPTAFPAGL